MYQQAQQGMALQYPADRPIAQPMQFQNGSPPVNVSGVRVHPEIAQAVPFIASEIANQVGANMTRSAAHMYLFNEMVHNNFNNNRYYETVMLASNYAYIGIKRGMFTNMQQAIVGAVQVILRMANAMNIIALPQLQQMIPPGAVNEARNMMPEIQGMQNEIFAMNNQNALGNQNMGVQQQQPMMQQGPFVSNNTGFAQPQQQYPQMHQPVNNMFIGPSANLGGGLFVNSNSPQQSAQQHVSRTANVHGTGKYDYLHANKPQVNQTPVQQVMPMPTPHVQQMAPQMPSMPEPMVPDEPVMDFKGENLGNMWKPTKRQTYVPAINSRTQVRVHYINPQAGSSKFESERLYDIIPIEQAGEENMDRNQHFVTPTSKALTQVIPPKQTTRMDAAYSSLDKLSNAVVEIDAKKSDVVAKDEAIKAASKNMEKYVMESVDSLDKAILSCKYLSKSVNGDDADCTAYRVDAYMRKLFVSRQDYAPVLQGFATCRNINALAQEMVKAFESHESDKELKEMVAGLDRYLKEKLSHVLTMKMSLPAIDFDSFMYDAPDLFDYIKSKFGEGFKEALIRYQGEFIMKHLNTVNDIDLCMSFDEPVSDITTEVTNKVFVYGIEEQISVTYVDVQAFELDINLVHDKPNLVMESTLPELYKFVRATVDSEIQKIPFAAHYMVTADDCVFELHKGIIGKDSYLISVAHL